MEINNLLAGYNILLCDDSITILRILSSYLQKAGGIVYTAINGKEGLEVCSKNDIHLIISDINMPEMDGFQFFKSMDEAKYNIPKILITDAEIDEYINLVIDHNIGNILSKPIEMRELVTVCYKLITGQKIFGLDNYLTTDRMFGTILSNSREIQTAIHTIIEFARMYKLSESKSNFLSIILDEVLSNAVYHAHGFTREKELRQEITLKNNDTVEVCYGANKTHLGISVTDFKGTLTKQRILKSFRGVIEEVKLLAQASKTGEDVSSVIAEKGRGLQMIRIMANEYYFNIKLNKLTQVIIIVELADSKLKKINSSIKIQEIY